MNCCDANGRCIQGNGCPAREKYINEGSEYLVQSTPVVCLKPGPTKAANGIEVTEWHEPAEQPYPFVSLDKHYKWLDELIATVWHWAGPLATLVLLAIALGMAMHPTFFIPAWLLK